jgi:hypothetical protein
MNENEIHEKESTKHDFDAMAWVKACVVAVVMLMIGASIFGASNIIVPAAISSVGVIGLIALRSRRFVVLAAAFPIGSVLSLLIGDNAFAALPMYPAFLMSPLIHVKRSEKVLVWRHRVGLSLWLMAALGAILILVAGTGNTLLIHAVCAALMMISAYFTNPNLKKETQHDKYVFFLIAFLGLSALASYWLVPDLFKYLMGATVLLLGVTVLVIVTAMWKYYLNRFMATTGAEQGEAGMVRGSKVER